MASVFANTFKGNRRQVFPTVTMISKKRKFFQHRVLGQ